MAISIFQRISNIFNTSDGSSHLENRGEYGERGNKGPFPRSSSKMFKNIRLLLPNLNCVPMKNVFRNVIHLIDKECLTYGNVFLPLLHSCSHQYLCDFHYLLYDYRRQFFQSFRVALPVLSHVLGYVYCKCNKPNE